MDNKTKLKIKKIIKELENILSENSEMPMHEEISQCPYCGSNKISYSITPRVENIRATCDSCGKYIKFVKKYIIGKKEV